MCISGEVWGGPGGTQSRPAAAGRGRGFCGTSRSVPRKGQPSLFSFAAWAQTAAVGSLIPAEGLFRARHRVCSADRAHERPISKLPPWNLRPERRAYLGALGPPSLPHSRRGPRIHSAIPADKTAVNSTSPVGFLVSFIPFSLTRKPNLRAPLGPTPCPEDTE